MSGTLRVVVILMILLMQVGCDQISKQVVRNEISPSQQIPVIRNFFTLHKVENTGAFMSLGYDLPEYLRIGLLIIFPAVLLIAAIIYLFTSKRHSLLAQIGIACMLGGGIGNLIDRILFGSVTDFLHLDFYIFQTGIFNLADLSIMMGLFLLIFERFIRKNPAATQPL